jgi:hypothetical protein
MGEKNVGEGPRVTGQKDSCLLILRFDNAADTCTVPR